MKKTLFTLIFCGFAVGAQAQTVQTLDLHPAETRPGLHIDYEATVSSFSYQSRQEEPFSVDVTEAWNGGAIIEVSEKEKDAVRTVVQVINALDDCSQLDPWIGIETTEHGDECLFWMSTEAFSRLAVEHIAFFGIDGTYRHDHALRWEFVDRRDFSCTVDGKKTVLKAIHARTTRGDEVIILDDSRYPLILDIKSGYFSFKVVNIEQRK